MSRRPGSASPEPPSLPVVLLARDHEHATVVAHVRHGTWRRVTRGAYVPEPTAASVRALATMVAVHERLTAPHWFSHESAALAWGLPTWRTPQVTHVRQGSRPSSRRDPRILRHGGPVDPRLLTTVRGLPVTGLALTLVDCARTLPALEALVVADAALRAGVDPGDALGMLGELRGHAGVARARDVIELADEGAESVGETATRFVLLSEGLPRPQTQIPVVTRLGTFWGDLGWEEWRLLVEYDGRAKYRSTEDLVREKRRQDALAEIGWRFVRVVKEDLCAPARLGARVRRLLPSDTTLVRRPCLAG